MTTMTIALNTGGYSSTPEYFLGRADAYDDSAALTVDQLVVRAGENTDYHPSLAYALGYMDRVIELRLELEAVSAAEAELAYHDHQKATRR